MDFQNCTRPAIEQFPEPLMDKKARQYGGLIIHIAVAIYMFIGLAVVCDDYFVPALDRISNVLNLPPDVAGATFMAAGSSGPELATAIIGVFVAQVRHKMEWIDVDVWRQIAHNWFYLRKKMLSLKLRSCVEQRMYIVQTTDNLFKQLS